MISKHFGLRLWIVAVFLSLGLPHCRAQTMPRQDVVDVPAIGEGLCVSNLFQSKMVLQREKPIHLWGWASPGDQVEVRFAGAQATALAGEDRRWSATLAAMPANASPQQIIVRSGSQTIQLDDILVGDVWLLGGQSNMEFELDNVENGLLEVVSANYPQIRLLTVPYGQGPEPQPGFARLHEWSDWFGRHFRKGDWEICSPETVREFSAIGYVFARRVHQASGVPIGVIDASRGGTTVETWTPLPVLRSLPGEATAAKLAHFDRAAAEWDPQADLAQRQASHREWIQKMTRDGKEIPEDRRAEPNDLRPGPLGDPNFPGHCYAGMLAPLAGFSLKGAIFHQGYNNAFDGSAGAQMYREIFPELIKAWRAAFDDPQMPFGIISLCTEGYPQTRDNYCEKMFDAGIEIREAQYLTFLDFYRAGDANVGYASSYDLRRRWYHPQLKIPAGERIARWALASQYGFDRQLEWKPPMLLEMKVLPDSLLLKFDTEVNDPEEGEIQGFAIAGEDRRFHPANVRFAEKEKDDQGRTQPDRSQLILASPLVPTPVHYRYAWGRNPLANLQAAGNKDLPLATQRSDHWRLEQVPAGILPDDFQPPFPGALPGAERKKILDALREQDRQRRLQEARHTLETEGARPEEE